MATATMPTLPPSGPGKPLKTLLTARSTASTSHERKELAPRMNFDADAQAFIAALYQQKSHVLQRLPPAANAYEGALSVMLFRGILMVAYGSLDTVVITLAADFSVLRHLRLPPALLAKAARGQTDGVTALAFRGSDAGLAVGVRGSVVIYAGWSDALPADGLWSEKHPEAALPFELNGDACEVFSLSFNRQCNRLAAIGNGVRVWQCYDTDGTRRNGVRWMPLLTVSAQESCGSVPYALGSIAPSGNLVAAAARFADEGRVWRLPTVHKLEKPNEFTRQRSGETPLARHSTKEKFPSSSGGDGGLGGSLAKATASSTDGDGNSLSYNELSFGRSGVSAMSWKPRGGGQAALLTVDRDGQISLWAKVPRALAGDRWMTIVARTPHMEGTGRCGGDFVDWGGGGGAASDELDAMATSAGGALLTGSVPRPSRCYQWAVSVNGVDVHVWRASGLDDRPQAAFARLEPSMDSDGNSADNDAASATRSMHIVSTRSTAPVPFTCLSAENTRLVKGYAISNGERRIRSAEPPEPPNVIATFTLSTSNGEAYLCRWEQCPTSVTKALCKARAGVGHRSPVVHVSTLPGSAMLTAGGVTAATVGSCGECILWSLNVGSPYTPLQVAGKLRGPHTAVCFPPERILESLSGDLERNQPAAVVFAVDAVTNSLNVYYLRERERFNSVRKTFAPLRVRSARRLARKGGPDFVVSRLHVGSDKEDENCYLVIGLDRLGERIVGWRVFVADEEVYIQKSSVLFEDCKHVPMGVSEVVTTIQGEAELFAGGSDGLLRIYDVQNELQTDDEVIMLRQTHALKTFDDKSSDGTSSPIVEIAAMPVASRVAALREDGLLTIWERFTVVNGGWRCEFRYASGSTPGERPGSGCLAFGTDVRNTVILAMGCGAQGVLLFRREQGLDWKRAMRVGEGETHLAGARPLSFVTPGVLVVGDASCLLVFSTASKAANLDDRSANSSFRPSNLLRGKLWTGRPAREVFLTLIYLSECIVHLVQMGGQANGTGKTRPLTLNPPPPELYLKPMQSSAPLDVSKLAHLQRWLREGNKIGDLTLWQRRRLAALTEACVQLQSALNTFDRLGASFALTAKTFLIDPTRNPGECLHESAMAMALHSTSVDALIETFVQSPFESGSGGSLDWDYCRTLGVGWWVTSTSHVQTLAERIARNLYLRRQEPDDCALWYIVLGKAKALAALYRTKQNKRMFEFLRRDFQEEVHRVAAAKNAYVLISKHRVEMAAGFFCLAGDAAATIQIVRSRMKDDQLALILARLMEASSPSLVSSTLESIVEEDSTRLSQPHVRAMALWLLNRPSEAIQATLQASTVPDAELTTSPRLSGSRESSVSRSSLDMNANDEEAQRTGGDTELTVALAALNHALAITSRPSMRADLDAKKAVGLCRQRAAAALAAEGDPVEALVVTLELLKGEVNIGELVPSLKQFVQYVTRKALKTRATLQAATSPRHSANELLELIQRDARALVETEIGYNMTLNAAFKAAEDLSLLGAVDSAAALAIVAVNVSEMEDEARDTDEASDFIVAAQLRRLKTHRVVRQPMKPSSVLDDVVLRVVVFAIYQASAVFAPLNCRVSEGGSPFGVRTSNASYPQKLARKLESVVRMLRVATADVVKSSFALFDGDLTRAMRLLLLVSAFLRGNWIEMTRILFVTSKDHAVVLNSPARRQRSSSSASLDEASPENAFVDELRQAADKPLLLSKTLKERADQSRRLRVSRHFTASDLADVMDSGEDPSSDDEADSGGENGDLVHWSLKDSELLEAEAAKEHSSMLPDVSVLSEGLSVTASSRTTKLIREQSLLSTTLSATAFAALTSCVSQMAVAWRKKSLSNGRHDYAILAAGEMLDALAMDAVYGWNVLVKFGRDSRQQQMSDEGIRHFAALWHSLASIPDFASALREAATVAGALDTCTTENFHRSSRESEYLHNPFPVRFSAAARGPWSGRGRYSVLYQEEGALVRSLCVASSDPPMITLCTPRGVHKVMPPSYAVPRTHLDDISASPRVRSESMNRSSSWSFFESEHEPMIYLDEEYAAKQQKQASRTMTLSEAEASALASHPRRRRFASGGTDGVVRLWNFGDNTLRAGLRDRNFGRVVSLEYSAYGDGLLSVYVSGHLAIWHDPDAYYAQGSRVHEGDAVVINAFGNRRASDGIFLDEKNVVAAVGDPTGAQGGASTSMGHSLRVFDVREPSCVSRATWTARVHTAGEARCLALLEDRTRVVTGGSDGTLSVVDIRTRTRVAELPAHDDEVICLAAETPRGRALASGCRNGDVKLWDARTLRMLDVIHKAHAPTRQWLSGVGLGGLVGVHGVRDVYLTDMSLITAGGDGLVKIWGPGWGELKHNVL